MNLQNKDQFAKAFADVDATSEPEEIRRIIDRDLDAELLQSKSGKWYAIKDGEFKPVEG
ncbi:hypothetical protein MYE70_10390 [Marinobacter alexandrii]|uniref:hypothetical protein n=1 Tax=Marinobacter alexandrii TaxID=2570351 RepID=UPI001FFEBE5F|nr:hypothetical protein [Marinobacter alexandrii]MCK2149474.1 hypothetical protein [Marinobacter alexandrii]